MATAIHTKQRYIEWLEKQVEEGQYILSCDDITGNLTVSFRKNVKKVTFALAADAFKRSGDVGHIAFGVTPVRCLVFCDRDDLSEASKAMIDESLLEHPHKEYCKCINRTATLSGEDFICNGCNKEIKL